MSKKRFSIIHNNFAAICKRAFTYTSYVYVVIGFVSIFASLSDCIPDDCTLLKRILISVAILVLLFILCFVADIIRRKCTNEVCIMTVNGNHHVYVQYGDMLSSKVNSGQKYHIVVDVNRCFDTIVDDHLVSSNTLHGRFFKKLYYDHQYTEESLNETIQKSISHEVVFDPLTSKQKPQGNLKRYPSGTVACVGVDESHDLYLLGLSKFDSDLKASTTTEEYTLSIQRLLEYCNTNAQGYPVIMPLMGGGLSRTGQSERALLEYLVKTINLNKQLITFDLHVVIWDALKNRLSIEDL